jgi:hypothetical protein
MITLNQLIILYKDIAARHKQVNDFAAVQDFNISTDSTHSYPILVVNPTAANLPRTENGYTSFTTVFDLQVIDLVNKDNDNRMDVLSDTQQILNDVVNEFNTHPYYIDSGIDTINNISFEPLRGVYDGDVDGWKISMELEHPNKLSYCGNPIENLQGFDFSPASVTVTDGLNQYELYPSDTYTCEPFASINVSNSNDTYSEDITTDLELPNINFTDSDGTTSSVPSMEDLVCAPLEVNEWLELTFDTRNTGNTPSDSFLLRMTEGDIVVDRGDGSDEINISNITGSSAPRLVFQYAPEGIYTMRIKGGGRIIYSFQSETKKLLSIDNVGIFAHSNNEQSYAGCTNMDNNSTDMMIGYTSLFQMFAFSGFTNIPKINTANTSNMNSIIRDTPFNSDLGYMDLRNNFNYGLFAANVTTWSEANYGNTLMGWLRWDSNTHAPAVGWVLQSNMSFDGGSSTLTTGSEAALARQYLIDILNWTITDGGLI